MTKQQAIDAIGQRFKVMGLGSDGDGTIAGDFIQAHCDDCRFLAEQPEQLKKYSNGENIH